MAKAFRAIKMNIQNVPDVVLYPISEPCEEYYEDSPGGPDDQQGCKVFEYILQHSERQHIAAEVHR